MSGTRNLVRLWSVAAEIEAVVMIMRIKLYQNTFTLQTSGPFSGLDHEQSISAKEVQR